MTPFDPAFWSLNPRLTIWMIAIIAGAVLSYFSAQFSYVLFWPGNTGAIKEEYANRRKLWLASFVFICTLTIFHVFVEVPVMANLRSAGKSAQVTVWINTRTGFYYCPDMQPYGRLQPGRYMPEPDALQTGYRPYFGQLCP